jgi:2-haloacid dehalogenase
VIDDVLTRGTVQPAPDGLVAASAGRMAMPLANVKAVTFDYFGTLVDVERGASLGMAEVLKAIGRTDCDPLQVYRRWDELNVQRYRVGPYRRYRQVAADAMAACLQPLLGFAPAARRVADLADLLLDGLVDRSPAHPEVPAVLEALRDRHLTLMPITNMDSDLWARTALTDYFPQVTTAEMAQAYKPSERIFRLGLDRLGLPVDQVLHVAISPWADIEGAKSIGLRVAWINRDRDMLGPWTPRPDHEFPDLTGVQTLLAG